MRERVDCVCLRFVLDVLRALYERRLAGSTGLTWDTHQREYLALTRMIVNRAHATSADLLYASTAGAAGTGYPRCGAGRGRRWNRRLIHVLRVGSAWPNLVAGRYPRPDLVLSVPRMNPWRRDYPGVAVW